MNQTQLSRVLFFAVGVFLLVVACGRIDNHEREKTKDRYHLLDGYPRLERRFSVDEIAKVYTSADLPTQTDFIQNNYTMQNAPDSFKQEYPTFTRAVEMKGYFNTGVTSTGGDPNDSVTGRLVIAALERISSWKKITGKDGKPVMRDAYSTSANGARIDDIVDGVVVPNVEVRSGALVLKGSYALTVGLEMKMVKQAQGAFDADLRNPKGISVFPMGTIVKADGIKIHMEFFPYANGWLLYAVAAAKLEKFVEQADAVTDIAENIMKWLRLQSVP